MDLQVKTGKDYISKVSRVIVRALSGNQKDKTFKGVVLFAVKDIYREGEVIDFALSFFEEYDPNVVNKKTEPKKSLFEVVVILQESGINIEFGRIRQDRFFYMDSSTNNRRAKVEYRLGIPENELLRLIAKASEMYFNVLIKS